ncbi:MAG: hypothetical protein ABW003_24125 [Microvirga sp.]
MTSGTGSPPEAGLALKIPKREAVSLSMDRLSSHATALGLRCIVEELSAAQVAVEASKPDATGVDGDAEGPASAVGGVLGVDRAVRADGVVAAGRRGAQDDPEFAKDLVDRSHGT